MTQNELPAAAAKKAANLVTDSRLAPAVGLVPILGLVFILRLVQWYLLSKEYPCLTTDDACGDPRLGRDFRSALPRLWFAVLLWPVLIGLMIVMFAID